MLSAFAVLSVASHKEYDQNAGAGMSTDNGAHIAGDDLLYTVLFPDEGFQSSGIFGAVTMGNESDFLVEGGFPGPWRS